MSVHAEAAAAQYEPGAPEVTNGKLAIWLFLASEIMLFGALFSSYIILRDAAPSWPRGWEVLNVPLAMLNTFVLISSSMTMVMAFAYAQKGDEGRFKAFLWATFALACGFLVIKSIEYGSKFHHHHFPSTNIFYAVYFTMTGLHGLHVIGGMAVMLFFLLGGQKGLERSLFLSRVECLGLYWHFVDLVWIFLFPALYLL